MKPRDRKPRHPQLWVGYGLILAVIVLGATAITTQVQYLGMRRVDAAQSAAIDRLKQQHAAASASAAQASANALALSQHNQAQDSELARQRADISRQRRAIRHLAQLRRVDAAALVGLRDELAARHIADARVRARLEQLERSNSAAHATIDAARNTGAVAAGKP